MLTHRGFSAWIVANNLALPEYLVAVDEASHRVSCWIPGTAGQGFTICWQDHGGHVDTCSFIILDGLVVPGRFLFGEGIASRGGVRVSKLSERPFMFQSVPETVTDSPSRGGSAKDAGMITLKIKRIKRVSTRPANELQNLPTAVEQRKVGDLFVGFGNEVVAYEQCSTWNAVPYDETIPGATKPSTYVSFVFRYRSPEFLETQGIAIEQKKTPSARPPVRRIASLPPHLTPELPQPDSLIGPGHPGKQEKDDTPPSASQPLPRPGPSADFRRTVSWSNSRAPIGGYEGEGQFFLPRNSIAQLPFPPFNFRPLVPSQRVASTSKPSERLRTQNENL